MKRLAISFALLLSGLAIAISSGCAQKGPQRHEITGHVTYKGSPVEDGIIDFIPQDGQGTQDSAQILNGEYRIVRDKGLAPGRYKILINIGDGTSGAGMAEPSKPRPGVTPGKERAPADWNLNSKVIREVRKEGPNRFDFNIP